MTEQQLEEYFDRTLSAGKLSHAYILEGDKEVSLRVVSRFAAALMGTSDEDPDIIRVTHEKPTIIRVEEIRSQLVDDIWIKPYRNAHKLYIVPDAELMGPAPQNAILKTLEEPPEYGMIILIAASAAGFLPTIISRAVCLEVQSTAESGAALDETAKSTLRDILLHASGYNASDVMKAAERIIAINKDQNVRFTDILDYMRTWCRDLLVSMVTDGSGRYFLQECSSDYRMMADTYSVRKISDIISNIDTADEQLRMNVNTELAIRILLVNMEMERKGFIIAEDW